MQKKCQSCGEMFEAKQEYFKTCFKCHSKSPKPQERKQSLSLGLLLSEYFDKNGNLLKEIFIGVPEQLANVFYQDKPQLRVKQLRDFYQIISKIRTTALSKGIEPVRSMLWNCITKLEYQQKREIVPQSFVDFMKHHLKIAEKDEKHLDAFYQHLDSIVCYFPKE